MFSAARRWLRRNRTPIAIGLGVVGAGYVVTQYVLSKINDARERMTSERIAKENLRRRFQQNQEDCTFTVLALLPTAMPKILETMDTEKITYEIQHMKGTAATKAAAQSIGSLSPPSISDTNTAEDDGRSTFSAQSESGVHASQMSLPSASEVRPRTADSAQDGGQGGSKPQKTKRQLWDDLTISSITRAYTLIYLLGLLTMLTRIQLNLLGRRSYLSSVVTLATGAAQATINLENKDDDNLEQTYGSDFEVNRRYLTFSWWLLNRGWTDIMQRVEGAARQVFGHLSPRDLLSLETFTDLTAQVRNLVEGGTPSGNSIAAPWLSFLLPPTEEEDFVLRESGILDEPQVASAPTSAAALRRLLDETSDLVESPAFCHVLSSLLDAGFATLLDKKLASEAFDLANPTVPQSGAGQVVRTTKAVLLPKILSVLTRQAHVIGNGMPNEYLQDMEAVADLEGFAAVVYSSNWESEMRDEGIMASAVDIKTEDVPEPQIPSLGREEESAVLVDTQASLESVWEKVKPK